MALGENMKMDRLIPEHKKMKDDSQSEQNAILPPAIKKEDSLVGEGDNKIVEEVSLGNPPYLDTVDNKSIRVVFTPSRRKTTRRISVLIEGEFTINNAEIIKDRLIEIFTNYDVVDFVLKNIQKIDLTALQIFHVFKNSYQLQNKTTSFEIDLLKDDQSILVKSGFADLFLKKVPTDSVSL